MIECICNGKYKVPALAVDVVIEREGEIVLVQRGKEPYKDRWALPGGFVEENERTEEAAKREAKEETNLKINIKELIGVYSDPKRDPRGHVVSITYLAKEEKDKLESSSDAKNAGYFSPKNLPELAFDHKKIIKEYLKVK